MPATVLMMRRYIKANGHLILEGNETKEELRLALLSLRKHTYAECKRPHFGTPIEALIPDISVLAPPSTKKRVVQTVEITDDGW